MNNSSLFGFQQQIRPTDLRAFLAEQSLNRSFVSRSEHWHIAVRNNSDNLYYFDLLVIEDRYEMMASY